MGVFFMMRDWARPSELWLQRMIEALEPDVATLACHKPEAATWRGRIPVLAIQDAPTSVLRRGLIRAGVPVWAKPTRTAEQVLVEAINAPNVSAVLVHYLDLAVRYASVWERTNKPLYLHCHGYDNFWNNRHHEAPHKPVFPPDYLDRVKKLAPRATIIANSFTTQKHLINSGLPADRIAVKCLGVEAPSVPPRREPRTRGLTILFLGRLVDSKGPDVVIRAFEMASDRGLDAKLVIAGDGPLRVMCEVMRARSKFADRIQMLGATDADTGERLRRDADIFTAHNCVGPITLEWESFGVSIIEAMAAALPIVNGDSGAMPEVMAADATGRHAGGILVRPGDVHAHADAFLQLASDPALRERLGRAGWERARSVYSLESERRRLREILGLPAKP